MTLLLTNFTTNFLKLKKSESSFHLLGSTIDSTQIPTPFSFLYRKRLTIYKVFLENMTDEQKFHVSGKLCQEVLGGIVDGAIDLEAGHELLVDAFTILGTKVIASLSNC